MITPRERLLASMKGEIIDRPPVALWRHFPVDDQHPGKLASATLQFQQQYDFDLVKVTPASSFCLKDWGVQDEWRGNPEGTREYTRRVISGMRDWETLPVLDPHAGHLGAQLECLRLIRSSLGAEIPVLQTVFSPLAQAKNLSGGERLISDLRLHPEAVKNGLKSIAETTRRFAEAALQAGIDGIFYAVQHAQAHLLTHEEYQTFGLAFDKIAMQAAGAAWCNVLHLHGHNVYFDLVSRLPVQIVNWHDRETEPSLSSAAALFDGVLCGGLRQDTLVFQDAIKIEEEVADAMAQTGTKKLLISTGCVVPVIAPTGNILAARRAVEKPKL